ncbi:hypothetical protein ACEPAF_182 [Sanghuangporus sanghuang]
MQVLEDLRKTWHKKERISIKRNERHIQKCTARSGRQDHRGHEHVCDQEEVAIVEIKRAPENSSADRVRRALGEAYGDLCFQVDVFFAGHPDVNAIVGIFVAGSYWNYEVFTRDPDDTSTDDDGEDDIYRPSSERGSSSQAREESVGSWSEESDGSSESSPDELDIIDKSEDPSRQDLEAEVTSEGDEESIGLDVAYILQTEVGELGLTSLMEAIENLEGCEEFDDPL